MATIDKITAILNTEIKMPFVKARESVHTGNPFKDSSFDRFTLPADIFEGSELKSQNRAKMIMSAIAGSVTNFTKRITEPVSAFCNKVRTNLTSAWNYAKNTTVTECGQSILNSISELGSRAKDSISSYGTNMKNSISEKLASMKKGTETIKISENTPVVELESLWINETELMKGAA